jgi:hypothetical protein
MESNRPIRSFLALCAIAVVAACSGGGGGGSTMPSSGNGSGSSGSSAPSASTTAMKEQSVANSALSVSGNSLDVDQFGATGSVGIQAIQRALASRNGAVPATATPTCQNGVEFSQSSSGSGNYTQTIEFFYDSACTQPRKEITLNITFSSGTGTFTGTEELWDMSGNVVDYKTDTGTFTFSGQQVTEVSVQRTVAAAPSATPFAENGFTCVFNSGQAIDCGDGIVATINNPQLDPHIYQNMGPSPSPSASASAAASPTPSPTPFEIGFAGTVTGTQSTPSPSPSASSMPTMSPNNGWNPQPFQLQVTVNGTGYTGATQSMTIAPATAPAWTITGGTQVTTLSGTATIGFGPSAMMSTANITLTDSADGLTITLTSIGHGGLSGNVTNSSGATVATVTVDANGDGVINYTSGATAQIRDWVILSS